MVEEGDALRYPGTGPDHNLGASHVCAIVKVVAEDNDVFLVPISSEMSNFDPTCPINPDEGWDPILKPSFAAYFDAKKSALDGVLSQIHLGKIKHIGKIPQKIYLKIRAGILLSDNVEPFIERSFRIAPPQRRILDTVKSAK